MRTFDLAIPSPSTAALNRHRIALREVLQLPHILGRARDGLCHHAAKKIYFDSTLELELVCHLQRR